jgi:hypothetical protein
MRSARLVLVIGAAAAAFAGPPPPPPPPALTVNATSPTTDGAVVLVNVSNPASFSPVPGVDWVGLFPTGASPAAVPLKLALCTAAMPGWNTSGVGTLLLQVWNVRQPLEVRLCTNGTASPVVLAAAPLTFADYGALLRPRVLPAADMAAGGAGGPPAFRVAWTSNASDGGSRLEWGPAPGPPYPYSAPAAGATVSRADLFGPPATGAGFFDLGTTLSATLALPPGLFAPGAPRRVFYRAYDDAHPGGSDWEGSFIAPPAPGDPAAWPFTFVAFGDLGRGSNDNATTYEEYGAAAKLVPPYLLQEISRGAALVHLFGDLSYAVGWLTVWDEYLALVSPFARAAVHVVSVGNHEADAPGSSSWRLYNDSNDSGGEGGVVTATLFPPPAPATAAAPYFLVASGPVSLVVMSSEHDFSESSAQRAWLARALAGINRTATPWVIVTLHRQPYMDTILPDLLNFTGIFAASVEPLLRQHRVNAVLVGHAHKYERLSAIYQGATVNASVPTVIDGEVVHVFAQPQAPVYYIAGTAGADFIENDCRRYSQPPYSMNCTVPEWSEEEGYVHGYLRITALNASALRLRYLSTANGTGAGDVVVDDVLITQ